jgi:Asp-tRNA(Asn)/Glu-tRNA(Gln) amidotransferase A subunit family amidase
MKNVHQSTKLIDIEYNDKEIEMMLSGLKENRAEYKKLHALDLNNNVVMSLKQSLAIKEQRTNKKEVNHKYDKKISVPEHKSELAFYSIHQLGSLLRNKSITSVDLTKFFIDRLKKYGDTLECVISLTETIAMQQAQQADDELEKGIDRGPLHGIPYGLKDLFAVKGTITSWGAAPYKNQIIEEDAAVYTALKKAGAVLVAKLTLGALAMGDNWYGGQTKNPWDLTTGSSGSSAGSTAATVAGLVPFAIGTETYGSIMSPSHTCGATGLRPTFGAINGAGAMTLSWSLDKVGPIARSAEDAGTIFNCIQQNQNDRVEKQKKNAESNEKKKTLRIGYAQNYFNALDSTSEEWSVLKVLREHGLEITPMHFPDTEAYRFDMIGIILGAEAAAAFDEFTRTGLDDQMTEQTKYDWPNFFRTSRTIPAVEYINANRHRSILMAQINDIMKNVDVVITPTFEGMQMAITNLTGHPALCLPIGKNKKGELSSITFLGNLFQEADLIQLGKLFQEKTTFDDEHPSLFK